MSSKFVEPFFLCRFLFVTQIYKLIARILALMAQASRSFLPLACRISPALASSSARTAALVVPVEFSLLVVPVEFSLLAYIISTCPALS